MKKYLFLAIALLGLASCAKDDLADGNKPIHGGEIEESYIAINLSASDITRAAAGAFEDGTAEERAVSHADFFFFDEAGNPFNVTGNPATAPGGGINHLRAATITFNNDTNTGDDISDSSEAVLLLKTYKGQYPSQIVAVLNWSPDNETSYSLEALHQAVAIQGTFKNSEQVDTNYFVMSNAVYAQGTTPVYATPLTMENIKTTEEAALGAPVNIYVERVAAKVKLNANPKYDLSADVQYQPLGGGTTINGGVFAKILGWDLYRDNSQSKLLKEIDGTWTPAAIGFNWNDEPWYRSYWAISEVAPNNDQIFSTSPFAPGAHTYIGENTTGKATCTKAVIKAQLVTTTVDGVDKTLELAKWNNVEYVDEVAADQQKGGESLRIAVANTLKYTYFYKEEGKYIGLKPEDLQCVAGDTPGAPAHVLANEVYFQLSTANNVGENRESGWYKLVNGVYTPMADDLNSDLKGAKALNNALKSVPEAVLYKNGETFYYVDIKHLGNGEGKVGDYGIVRNHVYNITINSIEGYGSPVYTGVSYLEYPQITEQQTYVSAKINILSWKLVNQSVDIKPNN
jgi:hypothetical protein